MIVNSYAPSAPLWHFVSQFWHYENYVLAHNWERIMPSCKAALLINLDEDELRWRRMDGTVNRIRGFAISGPQPEPFEIDIRQQRFIMGVAFHGCGAASLLRIPGYEIAGAHVGLDDVFGHEATLLHERLIEAGSAAARFRILEEWLLPKAMAHDRPCVPIVHALSLVERMPVSTVVDQLGISPKRLIQAFRDEVGLPPKLYCRVRRFER